MKRFQNIIRHTLTALGIMLVALLGYILLPFPWFLILVGVGALFVMEIREAEVAQWRSGVFGITAVKNAIKSVFSGDALWDWAGPAILLSSLALVYSLL